MKREEPERAKEVFFAALKIPESEREQFLAATCGNDTRLRSQIEQMIRDARAAEQGDFLPESLPTLPQAALEGGTAERATRSAAVESGPSGQGRIGSYRTLQKIGEGGMGIVFLAEQESPIRRRVALKIIKPGMDTREVVARFQAERQALALMDHPNIAGVFEAGATEDGRPYFVMEYVPGLPLTEYCDLLRLDLRERLRLFIPVCQAIHHAHQKGVIHRDIKPTNVLVAVKDGEPVPKVIDFGVAKAINQKLAEQTIFTEQGRLIGTPEYMSPEQAEMTGLNIDTTTDIYSLGVLLYELLTGALPFEHRDLLKAGLNGMQQIIRESEPPRPSTRISTLGEKAREIAQHRRTAPPTLQRLVRGELDWITMRAMEKDRTRRYPAASELAADIERYLQGEAIVAGPPSAAYRLRKSLRRHKTLVASAAVVFLALALGLAASTFLYYRAEHARIREREQTQKALQINQFLHNMLASARPSDKGREVTVREVLDEAAGRVETDLADQPEVQAAVRSTIGSTYMTLGLYPSAESQLRAALLTRQSLPGAGRTEVASSLDDLSALMCEEGDYDAAEQFSRSALSINRNRLGDRDPTVATNLSNLANLLKNRAQYAEAESLCHQSLAIRRELFGDNSIDVAASLGNLATLSQAQGRFAAAESLMRRALSTRRAVLKPSHPDIAASLNNLASILQDEGKYSEAEDLLREALRMEELLYGDQHPSIPETLNNLALVLNYQGKLSDAEPFFRRALALYKPILGEKHQSIATCMNDLAVLLQAQGKYPEAELLHRQALAMRRELLGDTHPLVASSLSNLALLLQEQGHLGQAEPLYREALAIQEAKLGAHHRRVASTLLGLGSLLVERGAARSAESLLRRCVEIRAASYPKDAWQLAYARNALGYCLASEERYVEAESLLVESAPIIKNANSLTLKQKQRALERIVRFYDKWNKPGQAGVYRAELRGLSE